MTEDIEKLESLYTTFSSVLINYGFQIFGAIITLCIGWIIAGYAYKVMIKFATAKNLNHTLSSFIANIVKSLIIGFCFIVALGKFGVTIDPLIAAIGASAFGFTLALQGPVSNFAAGLCIIITRPFQIGDTITFGSQHGIIKEIKLSYTLLANEDEEDIMIPNKHIVGEILVNSKENKVVEGMIGIAYESDPAIAVESLKQVLSEFDVISKQPTPQIGISEFADFSIQIAYRYWVPTNEYHKIRFKVNQSVFDAFKANKIRIPYPIQHIHLKKDLS